MDHELELQKKYQYSTHTITSNIQLTHTSASNIQLTQLHVPVTKLHHTIITIIQPKAEPK